jgi:hypothetical protein
MARNRMSHTDAGRPIHNKGRTVNPAAQRIGKIEDSEHPTQHK